ncbi:hypothetical protein ACFL9T_05140 [Thermodesulfobacteriota bacterium]
MNYARIEPASGPFYEMTIEVLIENWKNYDIYYTGTAGEPFALLFDPLNDDKNLMQDNWHRADNQKDIKKLVGWIGQDEDYPYPYVILDADDQMYGYIYTARPIDVAAKKIDEKTLIVYRILPRPEYEAAGFIRSRR